MTSQKQIEANRINAQKSTGPNSEEGKTVVSRNAVRHGILSDHIPLNDADFQQYTEFHEVMRRQLQPVDGIQNFLADRIISTAWRLRRIIHVETLMLQKAGKLSYSNSYREAFEGRSGDHITILSRYERALENSFFRALREFKTLKERNEIEISQWPIV